MYYIHTHKNFQTSLLQIFKIKFFFFLILKILLESKKVFNEKLFEQILLNTTFKFIFLGTQIFSFVPIPRHPKPLLPVP
jgi:hypothetical protein